MNILINILIYALACGLIAALINYAPIDSRFKQIATYVVLVVFVILLLMMLVGSGPVIIAVR